MASTLYRKNKHFTASSRVWCKQPKFGAPLPYYVTPFVFLQALYVTPRITTTRLVSWRTGLSLQNGGNSCSTAAIPTNNHMLLTVECSWWSFYFTFFLFINSRSRMSLQNELLCAAVRFFESKMRRQKRWTRQPIPGLYVIERCV